MSSRNAGLTHFRSGHFAALLTLSFAPLSVAADTVVKAKKIYSTGGKSFSPGAMLIRDGKVIQIGENVDISTGVEVVDLKDAVIMPGVVNFSTTLGVAGGDSEITKEITPTYRPLRSLDWQSREFQEARAAGVTSAGIFPGDESVVSGMVSVVKTDGAKKDRVVKPDVALAIAMGTGPTGRNSARGRPDSIFMRQPTNRMGVVWLLRSALQQAKTDANSEMKPAVDSKIPFFATARVAADVEAVVRLSNEFGFKPVIVGGEEAHEVADLLAKSKTPVVLRSIGTRTGVGPEQTDIFWNQAGVLHKAGVQIAIAGEQPLEMAKFAVRYGLPPVEAMKAITETPAKLLGVDGRVGALAEGKDADFVVLSGEPFEFTTRVVNAAVAGKLPPPPKAPVNAPIVRRPQNSTDDASKGEKKSEKTDATKNTPKG
jgi:imidazolonepropionase-like amidohydrolase